MKKHRQLKRDSPGYIESTGTRDQAYLFEALQSEGEDTVLRVGFNVADRAIPFRMLGLFASAYYTNNLYFPRAQLQMVATAFAGERVNAYPAAKSVDAARYLFDFVANHPELESIQPPNVVFATDKPTPTSYIDSKAIYEVLKHKPEATRLARSAAHRSADFSSYVAEHIRIHDTLDSVQPLDTPSYDNPALVEAKTIVSMGGQLERNFYSARMGCIAAGLEIPNRVQKTAQLFTKHLVAPYIPSRQSYDQDPPITDRISACKTLFMSPEQFRGTVVRDVAYASLMLDEVGIAREGFQPDSPAGFCKIIQGDNDYFNLLLRGQIFDQSCLPPPRGLFELD